MLTTTQMLESGNKLFRFENNGYFIYLRNVTPINVQDCSLELFWFSGKVLVFLSFFFFFFCFLYFHNLLDQDDKIQYLVGCHFLKLSLGQVVLLRLADLLVYQNPREGCVSCSRADSVLCIYYLFVCSNVNFLRSCQWISSLTHLCLVSYSFCSNLLYSFIIWLIISTLSPHYLHLLFCSSLSVFSLTLLVIMAFFVLLFEDIKFLSGGFAFLVMSMFSCMIFHLFVALNVHYYYLLLKSFSHQH